MITTSINSPDHGYTPGVIGNRPAILEWLHELRNTMFSKKISPGNECENSCIEIDQPECDPNKEHIKFSVFAELYAGVYELK